MEAAEEVCAESPFRVGGMRARVRSSTSKPSGLVLFPPNSTPSVHFNCVYPHKLCTHQFLHHTTFESPGKPFGGAERREPTRSRYGLSWTDPEASKRLVRWLMNVINSQGEYELLERDLQELEALHPSHSNRLKGGGIEDEN